MDKVRFATIWLGGCSGCHMSFLDMDEWLFELADKIDLVYSPFADVKEYPDNVDVCLVEGSVANEDNLALVRQARKKTKILISFGDCAVTANVPGMRNPIRNSADAVLKACYVDMGDTNAQMPEALGVLPRLRDHVQPVHELVSVDYFMPGCPPSADRIRNFIDPLLRGEEPPTEGREAIKFG